MEIQNKRLFNLVFLLFLLACSSNDLTIGEKYNNSIEQLEFREIGRDMEIQNELVINFTDKTFKLYHLGKLYHSGKLELGNLDQIKETIGNIKESQLDRIYNVNSADVSLFQLRFWGKTPFYAHMIEIYDDDLGPKEVVSAIKMIRKSLRHIGQSK